MPTIVPVSFADLTTPLEPAVNKVDLLLQLAALGFPALSWETGSVPSGLVEIQANSLTKFQENQAQIAESGLNETAFGEGLTIHAAQVYDNTRQPGLFTIGYVTLTDSGNAGPFTFSATGTSFSRGPGGLLFNGLVDAETGSTTVTIPQGGSRNVVVQATSVGAAYNVAPGSINFFARGVLPGVTTTNPTDWLTKYASGQAGTNEETDDQLRDRDRSKWGTLGTGSPERAYRYWAATASQSVKKVAVFTNLDMFDSGRVDVFIAGNSGSVGPAVVAAVQNYIAPQLVGGSLIPETAKCVVSSAVQNYIAPQQVGGSLIPETAKCVVSSAVQVNVNVTATIFVQAAYNTAAFAAQIDDALLTYFQALDIGAFISTDRVAQVMLSPAGLSPGIIVAATVTSPLLNVQLAYNEVAALTGTRTLVSV